MYNEYSSISHESDEYLSKGICSINPTLSSLHEVILLHLKELAFYLLKLKEFGITNDQIKKDILDSLFGIVINAEYNQEEFQQIISKLDKGIEESKILYINFCKKNSAEVETLKLYFKHNKDFSLSDAIKKGEKYFLKKSNTFTIKQKNLFDIMLFLIKSMCIKIIELQELGKEYKDYYVILSMLNAMNLNEFSEEIAKKEIKQFIQIYYRLNVEILNAKVELYGEITPTEVSFSTVPGKAILVSCSDFKSLEHILKATENTEINVYTHGAEMLMAHAFPKLHSHPNLKGHFCSGIDSSLIDFAEFPGAILMTKVTMQHAEYLYRGRLFTLDPIAPTGIIKINDNNFEPLIKSALDSKGFIIGIQKLSLKVGFSENEINKKVDDIINKIVNKEIKHLYFIVLLNYPGTCPKYFETFLKLLPKDCYAISLSCNKKQGNIFHLDSFYEYSLVYKILKKIGKKIPLPEMNMTLFLTKCDKHTISNLLYLKEIGIKNIYMCKCPSTLINPILMKTLQETFDIKEFYDPKTDLEETLDRKL